MVLADETSHDERTVNQDLASPTIDEKTSGKVGDKFICIKEVRSVSRAKALRLKIGDVIIGIEGKAFNGNIEEFLDVCDEIDEQSGALLTIWREGTIFNLIIYGPLGCVFEFTPDDITIKLHDLILDIEMGEVSEYVTFELLRNIKSECDVFDTRVSQLGIFIPPLWLIKQRLWEPLIATLAIYAVTFSVHWALFVIATILLGLYFRKAQLGLLRSFSLHKEKQIWMVIAAKSMFDAQKTARLFDNRITFRPDLIGPPPPPEIDQAKKRKKKKRRSAIPGM